MSNIQEIETSLAEAERCLEHSADVLVAAREQHRLALVAVTMLQAALSEAMDAHELHARREPVSAREEQA